MPRSGTHSAPRASQERLAARAAVACVAAVLAACSGGCIIPDTRIDVQPERTNPGAVRIVQAVPLSPQADAACAEEPGLLRCPQPPITIVPGLIEIEDQAFCTCENGRDGNAAGGFDIYVEDPDVDDEGEPRDELFAAFLLDVPPNADLVSPFVAYTNYLPNNTPALRVLGDQPIERPVTNLKAWSLGVETTVDLCNNNNGNQLTPGLHSLRLVVTDRPWPFPVLTDADGSPERNDGAFERDEALEPLVGVPDLPGGASYAVANFVFRCRDASSEEDGVGCNCEDFEG